MTVSPYNQAVHELQLQGSIELTYDSKGHTVYRGWVVYVPHITQKAQEMGIRIASARQVIDDGKVTYVISK